MSSIEETLFLLMFRDKMKTEIISTYHPISLDVLEAYNLCSDRLDKKYILPYSKLEEILSHCKSHYDVLEINNHRIFDYNTTYYDTADLHMYHEHLRGKSNRFKIRKREYVQTKNTFIEIKFSDNKGRTKKQRIETSYFEDAERMIKDSTNITIVDLHETLNVGYKRITLVHKTKNEKITIDTFLRFTHKTNRCAFNNIVFAEVKTNTNHDIDFCNTMKAFNIRTGSLSKYCLGIASIFPEIKKNNFKQSLNNIIKKEINATRQHI